MSDGTDEIWRRDEVDSPCIKICTIHPVERLCIGCLRTIEEITAWGRMDAPLRQAVMAELAARAPRLRQRRGGRAGRLGAAAE
ncbi:MAG: DUF1289 domain-containing protein [Paracoccaceae bacterium]